MTSSRNTPSKLRKLIQRSVIAATFILSSTATNGQPGDMVIGALGDSLSAGFNAKRFGDNRDFSWTTGLANKDQINSHLARLSEREGLGTTRVLKNHNEAITGSKSQDLARQSRRLVRHKPDYVTITIGANDVCHWDANHEPQRRRFEDNVRDTLVYLKESNQDIRILLMAIPDIHQVWSSLVDFPGCQARWDLYNICRPLLDQRRTDEERRAFRKRWVDANDTLQSLAEEFSDHVRFDPKVAEAKFEREHVSKLDCFHPSVAGQNYLAEVAWNSGWFGREDSLLVSQD